MSKRKSGACGFLPARQSADIMMLLDAILLTVLPAASVLAYFLSSTLQYQLAFDPRAPTIGGALTAPVVHVEQAHLFWNMFGYLTLIPLAYALTSLAGRQRLFRVVFVIAAIGTPLLTSGAEVYLNSNALSGGLSGILFVFVGFLPLASGAYLEEWFDTESAKITGPLMQFLSIVITGVMITASFTMSIPSSTFVPFGAVLALGALAIVYACNSLTSRESSLLSQIVDQPVFGDLALCAMALSLLLPLLLVYPIVGGASAGVSSVSHYIGFFTGAFVPLFLL